ncbi:hypothetical protein TanjilG_19720 [Lupinus angustifolius]|uniref:Uncharacterized protein n=1 Tax=Lupinus angustifolius TaxID=3871 RepID=A0A4P1RAK3_LUPAN|nr:hypothetical protein TanjilG_19720 [Lupinus angustifolius]
MKEISPKRHNGRSRATHRGGCDVRVRHTSTDKKTTRTWTRFGDGGGAICDPEGERDQQGWKKDGDQLIPGRLPATPKAPLDGGSIGQGCPDHGHGGAAMSTLLLVVSTELNDVTDGRSVFFGFQKAP